MSWSPERGPLGEKTDGRTRISRRHGYSRLAVLGGCTSAAQCVFGTFDARDEGSLRARRRIAKSGRSRGRPFFRFGDDVLRFRFIFDLFEDIRVDSACSGRPTIFSGRGTARAPARTTPRAPPISNSRSNASRLSAGVALGSRRRCAFAACASRRDGLRAYQFGEAISRGNAAGITPRAFHAASLPGRGPNSTLLASQESDDEQHQTQAGPSIRPGRRKSAKTSPRPQNADSGDQQDSASVGGRRYGAAKLRNRDAERKDARRARGERAQKK